MTSKTFTLPVLSKKIAFSTIVQFLGRFVHIFLAAATVKIISNYFVNLEANYGIYATIAEFALFLSVAANLGIFGQTVRAMSENPKDGKIFINALLLRIITAAIFFVTGLLYLAMAGTSAVFFVGATIFCGALFFDYVTSVCDGMLQANYLMGRATIALVLGRMISLGFIFLTTKIIPPEEIISNIPMFFLGTMSGSIVTAGLSFFFVWRKIEISLKMDRKFMFNILKLSLPFGIINIFNNLYFRFLPDYFTRSITTDEQFATFNISFKIAQVLSLFSTFLMFSVLPGFKQYLEAKNWQKVKTVYKRVWMLLLAAGILLVVFGSLLGPFMLELLTHKKYFLPEFWFILPLMLLLAAISYGYDMVLITLFALEKEIWFLKKEIFALCAAGVLFGISFLVDPLQVKILFIILGAIVGESFMVLAGRAKIRKFFRVL
jgi:O-antigen/teichoic acid export membrane protein